MTHKTSTHYQTSGATVKVFDRAVWQGCVGIKYFQQSRPFLQLAIEGRAKW